MTRRIFHHSIPGLLFLIMLPLWQYCSNSGIDRQALVQRHIPVSYNADPLSPFTVGNGEFAFTVDITGLQTFPEYYESGIPLGTQSQWGWHSVPNPENFTLDQTFEYHATYGRMVAYAGNQHSPAGQWLRANPHRLHLGKIGLKIIKADGTDAQLSDISNIHQKADIWEGIIKSSFQIDDESVSVETACHPDFDQIAARIQSELLKSDRIQITVDFPYGSLAWGKQSADWNSPEKHSSEIIFRDKHSVLIRRILDETHYFVQIQWNSPAILRQAAEHTFVLSANGADHLEFDCQFSKEQPTNPIPTVAQTFQKSCEHWQHFWKNGGAIDLSQSKDPRAHELERRIVLSRYLTAIQCAGSLPPQETGLTFNSWYGKFHLEMHWWHAVQFALWGYPELLEKSLGWYARVLPEARQMAELQGYSGARWQKMVGCDSRESPSTIGVYLIWQQPHPIYYAELMYRNKKDQETLEKYQNLVFKTAEFMASYAHWDAENERYVLGPPLIPAQEIYSPDSTWNPTFELSYWAFGLKTAQKWREQLGLERVEKWDHVLEHLSKFPISNGLYQNAEIVLNTFEDSCQRNDHPTLLGAFGMLPNDSIDVEIMTHTLEKVMESWNWENTWGWDYPLIAMTAARVGKPEIAIEALMLDVQKNTYLLNGHNYQNETLPIYLPGNGGILTAVAMMAAGWDGAPDIKAPGFPKDGNWVVKYEGLTPLF